MHRSPGIRAARSPAAATSTLAAAARSPAAAASTLPRRPGAASAKAQGAWKQESENR